MCTESMWCNFHEESVDWSTFEWKGCWGCHYFSGLDPEEYVYVSEAANIFGVCTETVRRWIKNGNLEGIKFIRGRSMFTCHAWKIYLVTRESVDELLRKNGMMSENSHA